jgi:hypothetical protein
MRRSASYGASYLNDKHQHVTRHGSFDLAGHASYVKMNKVGSFLNSEFQLPASAVSGNGIKSVTLTLWDGPAGRPVKIAATGASPTVHLSAQETFGNYNKPVTIHAPG